MIFYFCLTFAESADLLHLDQKFIDFFLLYT
nr:MAG TPA: hypothetical protein [Caudoviricetes sp.]